MRRHVIIGRFGLEDQVSEMVVPDEVVTRLNLMNSKGRLRFGISRALTSLRSCGINPTEIGIDLFLLAIHVQAADTRISRITESQDTWTREIRLVVPVSDPERWFKASGTLIKMLNFLTGDRWIIKFRPRPPQFKTLTRPSGIIRVPFNSVALFSGGLDSLVGSIDMLESGGCPLLVSHCGEGAVSRAQHNLFRELQMQYPTSQMDRFRFWTVFPSNLVNGSEPEITTRGRSFLFFSAAIFAGTGLDKSFVLKVPENGFISLNAPLDMLRLGALSTRTTHPFYMARWNDLLKILDIDGQIDNPYWDRTKGDMVAQCSNPTLLQRIVGYSLSCSSPSKGRWHGHTIQHCGYCLPCLVRRAALQSNGGEDPTIYTLPELRNVTLNTSLAEGQQVRSFQVAVNRLEGNPSIARLLIHKAGPLSDYPERWSQYSDVYTRGLHEVASLIRSVVSRPA